MKCKSIIEIEKELRKEKHEKKKRPFVPVATPGTKGHPLLSRTGVPGWETETTAVSQPGQINVFVVVMADDVKIQIEEEHPVSVIETTVPAGKDPRQGEDHTSQRCWPFMRNPATLSL